MAWLSWGGALATDIPSPCPTQGRFTIAAKHHISIAEIYETELVDIEKVSRGAGGGAAAASHLGPGLLSLSCSLRESSGI